MSPSISSTVAYAQIDWHDFVVVETVDFQQAESGRWRLINILCFHENINVTASG